MRKEIFIVICLLAIVFLSERTVGNCPPTGGEPINCLWETWSQWKSCTALCGTSGTKTRTRGIAEHAECDGSPCSGPSSQTVECNRFCYNGGTPQSTYCTCPDEYWGHCCNYRKYFCLNFHHDPKSTPVTLQSHSYILIIRFNSLHNLGI